MRQLLNSLWADENGFIISAELVLVGTIVGLAMVAGLADLSTAVTGELKDMARAFSSYNQSEDDWDENDWSEGQGSMNESSGGNDFNGEY